MDHEMTGMGIIAAGYLDSRLRYMLAKSTTTTNARYQISSKATSV